MRVAERMTVGLIPKASADLLNLIALIWMSKTDLINRSVSLYAFVADQLAQGNELLVRRPDGEVETIRIV